MAEPNQNNIDDLLIDVKSLLQDEEEPARQRDRTLKQKLDTDREATQIFDERYTSIIRGASESADRAARDYAPPREPEGEAVYEAVDEITARCRLVREGKTVATFTMTPSWPTTATLRTTASGRASRPGSLPSPGAGRPRRTGHRRAGGSLPFLRRTTAMGTTHRPGGESGEAAAAA